MKTLICSWNVNARKPHEFKEDLENLVSSVDEPDIIVVGLQEIIDLENKQKNASEYHSLKIFVLHGRKK